MPPTSHSFSQSFHHIDPKMTGAGARILAVIMDLDGTLLDTERATRGVLGEFLARYGKIPDPEKEERRIGQMHKESAAAIVKDYELPMTAEEYSATIMPMYQEKWSQAQALPGANRLIKHLVKHGIPFALASNSIGKHIDIKISQQQGWKESFSVILGSDAVSHGKPSPDLFLEAAKRLGVETSNCLIIEDSVVGVRAGKAAGANVVAVPSMQSYHESYSIADCLLHSLLEFTPEYWGLPPFEDWMDHALPIEPLSITGLVDEGIKHVGCTMLNIITDCSSYSSIPDQVSGVFFGWVKLKMNGMYKVVLSTGWDLALGAGKRAIKTWLFGDTINFTSREPLLLLLVGFIRELHKEDTLEALEITKEDMSIATALLDLPIFSHYKSSPLLDEATLQDLRI